MTLTFVLIMNKRKKKNVGKKQLELFQKVSELVVSDKHLCQDPANSLGKIISLNDYVNSSLVSKFYEEAKKITSHLD